MDPSSYTPPTPTAVPASAPPVDAPANPTSENQPSYDYDEMICTAIATLEKGKGSTKNAIGNYMEKYMEQTNQGLPSNHDDLLVEHLNVLTRKGRLVMVNRSYMVPNSPSPSARKRGRPCKRKFDELPPDDVPLDDNPPKRGGRLLKIEEVIAAIPVSLLGVPVSFVPPPGLPVPAYAVPPSGASPEAVGAGSGGAVKTPYDSSGSSAGRPKKVPSVEEELRRKLKHFQSKVKEYIREIKPHFNIDSSIKVIVAIQGLQRLATMDLDGPLPNETQELPPQQ